MNWVPQDFRYALRFLRKRWGVTSVAVLVMALGISLTASMYAIIRGVVIVGPDYERLDDIMLLRTTIPKSTFNQSVRLHDYLDWKAQQTVFDEMSAHFTTSVNLSGSDTRAESYRGVRMTASTFDLLGVQPFMGRAFTAEDDVRENPDIAIIGYHVWENRFSSDPGILGRTIRVDAGPTTVIGVMPKDFGFPEMHDIWLPLATDPGALERREGPGLQVLGVLSAGVTREAAHSQLKTIAARLEQAYPEANEEILPVTDIWKDEQFVGDETRALLYTMFVAVIGVLLIACSNVANLLFALTIARGKELAVRTAMGAGRARVLRQLLSETLVLAIGGAALGIALSKFSLDMFTRAVTPLGIPPFMVFELSPAVIVFVIGITFFAALASGILPALQATRGDVHGILQDQGRGSSSHSMGKWSSVLLVVEVSLSCALLYGAGLMVRSTLASATDDHGVRQEGILTARVGLPGVTYADSTSRFQLADRLYTELEAIAGVNEVALTSSLPVLGTSLRWYGVQDHEYADDGEYSFGGYTFITPSFFDILGVSLVSGRAFNSADEMGGERVAIVDRNFAEKNWPGEDALGKQIRLGRSDSENPWLLVVGVVSDIEMTQPLDFQASPPEGMFVPMSQQPVGGFTVMLKGRGDPLTLATPLRDVISRLDLDIPVSNVDTLEGRVEQASLDLVIIGGMFAIFGVVALILASIGLYAVTAFSVSRRTSEVGIRMALGADGGRIIRLILGQGTKPVGIGIVIGLVLAVGLGFSLQTFLYDVNWVDPLTITGVPVFLALVSLIALLVPANRAARIAPVVALREE